MALSLKQDRKLTSELLAHCGRIIRETRYTPVNLRSMLTNEGAQSTLRRISSRETSGLARLYELNRPDLAIEKYVLDSDWATVLDPAIVTQCRLNLGRVT